jgi:hypothetical protein
MALKPCRECGKEISTDATTCPLCGRAAPTTAPMTREQKWGCGVAALAVFANFVYCAASTPETPTDYGPMAASRCKEFVRARLRSPSTADFPFLDYTAIQHGADTFAVRSYVDAQNAFGGIIRSQYVCRVLRQGSDWRLIDVTMAP